MSVCENVHVCCVCVSAMYVCMHCVNVCKCECVRV